MAAAVPADWLLLITTLQLLQLAAAVAAAAVLKAHIMDMEVLTVNMKILIHYPCQHPVQVAPKAAQEARAVNMLIQWGLLKLSPAQVETVVLPRPAIRRQLLPMPLPSAVITEIPYIECIRPMNVWSQYPLNVLKS